MYVYLYTEYVIYILDIRYIVSISWEFFLIRCEVLGQGCRMCTDCKALSTYISINIYIYIHIYEKYLSHVFLFISGKFLMEPQPGTSL